MSPSTGFFFRIRRINSRLPPGGFWALSTTRSFGKRLSQEPVLADENIDLLGRSICLPDGVTGMAPT